MILRGYLNTEKICRRSPQIATEQRTPSGSISSSPKKGILRHVEVLFRRVLRFQWSTLSSIFALSKAIMSTVLIAIAAVIIGYVILNRLSLHYRKGKFPQTKAPPHYQDYALGLRNVYYLLKFTAKGTLPEEGLDRFVKMGVDTFSLDVMGKRTIFTRDPENIKAVLGTQFNDFCLGMRRPQFAPLLGDGIFTLDGAGWKHSRAMLRPQFAREQVAHVKSLEPHLQILAKHVRKADGKAFDIQELFFRLTIDSATEFLFGESVESLRDSLIGYSDKSEVPGKHEFADCFNRSQLGCVYRVVGQDLYWLFNPPLFRRDNKVIHQFTDYYVKKALDMPEDALEEASKDGYTFLYELAKQTRDPLVLRDQALNILLAGRDTTAGLLSFMFRLLSDHQDTFNRLREEIGTNFGLGEEARVDELSFELLKKCEYLKAVVNELLRLYLAVPRNFRFSSRDTTLPRGGGPEGKDPIFIPKGTMINYEVFAMHRDEKYYGKDARDFRPERWFEPSTNKLGWAYLPFNGGPRICLGQQFALTEAYYITARLLQMFGHIEDHSDGSMRKMTHLTMSLMDGCPIALY